MTIKELFNAIANAGVKTSHHPWEIYLTRKLNLSALLGSFNVCLALLVFNYLGYHDSVFELSVVLIFAPFVFFLNKRSGYVSALYLFASIGCFLFYFLSVKMGRESFAFLFFFPLTITMIQMAARKEIYKHLAVIVVICLLSFLAVIVSYRFHFFDPTLPTQLIGITKNINIFFSFMVSIGFMFIISAESIKQEQKLKAALRQKEVLLAELFHRVKNNLNIVTSLLNLKKASSCSVDVQNALEECRTLVFSMALVHTKIYNMNSIEKINFSDYLKELVPELINSIGGAEAVDFDMYSPSLDLSLSQAIPCGLIVNELITNAFKHGRTLDRKLSIRIRLKEYNNSVFLEVGDNGPGFPKEQKQVSSLGLDLIKSLVEQLDGEYTFQNQNGLQFNLRFSQ